MCVSVSKFKEFCLPVFWVTRDDKGLLLEALLLQKVSYTVPLLSRDSGQHL